MGQITNPDRVVFCAQTRISRRSSGLRSLRYVGHLPSSGDATRRPIGPSRNDKLALPRFNWCILPDQGNTRRR